MKLLIFLVVFAAFASVQASRRPIAKRQTTFANCTDQEALAMVPTDCRDELEDFIAGREFTDAEATTLICESGCLRPIIELNSRCDNSSESDVEQSLGYYENGFCNSNENGEKCYSIYDNGNGRLTEEWDSIQSNCLTGDFSLPDPLVCMENCASALTNSVTNVGCCINIFNYTVPGTDYMDANETNYRLWAACGVQVPGFCSGATTRATAEVTTEATAGATAMHFSILLASIMVLIAASLAY